MQSGVRLLGSAGSGLANLLLLYALAALWPRLPYCGYAVCVISDPDLSAAVETWRPFIDNPGGGPAPEKEPECPAPGGGDYHSLTDAPLPDGFDAAAYAGRALYACVLVGEKGEVLAARILRGTGRARLDGEIVRAIRRDWRFTTPDFQEGSSWQRVRLNPGPVSGLVYDPPLLF